MRQAQLALFLVVAFVTSSSAQAPRPGALDQATLERRIDEFVAAHMKAHEFTGTVLLAKDGKPVFLKSYGYANREWRIPNTPDTKFSIGSITKSFTSVLIMQLREQGKLKLEDSVCLYITRCPDTWKPVNLHHLLTHTSGIPSYTSIGAWAQKRTMPHTTDQVMDYVRDLPLQWTPGERYAYNNSGYFLLGMVIEKVTGRKYEEALKALILTPLGLTDTGYNWPGPIIPKRAAGYAGRGEAVRNAAPIDMQHPFAAGAIYSTAADMLKWEQALYGETLLPEAAKTLMWTPVLQNYGYGWDIEASSPQTFGHARVGHTGGGYGFGAVLTRVPEPRLTVIVLGNTESAPESAIVNGILAIYYGQPYTIPPPPLVLEPAVLDKYAGRYEPAPGVELIFTREGRTLFYQPPGQNPLALIAETQTKFAVDGGPVSFEFVAGPDGAISHVLLSRPGGTRPAKRIR